jgi:hypothetical protein
MAKAFSGALSLVLTLVVLRLALPQAADLLAEIIMKVLTLLNGAIDHASTTGLQF